MSTAELRFSVQATIPQNLFLAETVANCAIADKAVKPIIKMIYFISSLLLLKGLSLISPTETQWTFMPEPVVRRESHAEAISILTHEGEY